MKKEEAIRKKSEYKLKLDFSLLAISFTIFTFIATLNPDLLKENLFLTFQLIIAIPFFMTSIQSRMKIIYSRKIGHWKKHSFIFSMIGYGFLINVIGMLVVSIISLSAGLIFLGVNIAITLIYSAINVFNYKEKIRYRLFRDSIFILILIIFGILPSLGIY